MARTALTPTAISRSGVTPTLAAANADGHSVLNDGQVFVEVANAGASPITVTLPYAKVVDGQTVTSKTVSVPAASSKLIGPFIMDAFNHTGQVVHIDLSTATDVTIGAFKLIPNV